MPPRAAPAVRVRTAPRRIEPDDCSDDGSRTASESGDSDEERRAALAIDRKRNAALDGAVREAEDRVRREAEGRAAAAAQVAVETAVAQAHDACRKEHERILLEMQTAHLEALEQARSDEEGAQAQAQDAVQRVHELEAALEAERAQAAALRSDAEDGAATRQASATEAARVVATLRDEKDELERGVLLAGEPAASSAGGYQYSPTKGRTIPLKWTAVPTPEYEWSKYFHSKMMMPKGAGR